ncbi:hypothetical protein SAMN06265795_11598 [Noviherbaspirillum humi]|uniref:Probable inorganic carbon transporter subunit DabA n=1 Tax=Noviherbaspirillum humi TaxID=1688639 RepID=A0A239KBK1_9BURK|nr:DUF2309 domain-containing protein [Noviherbaspirillum humi]SNT15776.1 hypothetical protein SAMN06265795_11598 [Noviherbaspirillum humi]
MNPADALFAAKQAKLDSAIDAACAAIAPTWPLDRFIAVNPYWGWVAQPFDTAARRLRTLAGSTMRMPRAYYRAAWEAGEFTRRHLEQAAQEAGADVGIDRLIDLLNQPEPALPSLPLLSDVLDAQRDLIHEPAWRNTITHQVSQFCAAWFDADQADWHPPHGNGLYADWRAAMMADHGVALLMNAPEVAKRARNLTADARAAIALALERLAPPEQDRIDLLSVALLRIGGWAAWCAYLRWQARLQGRDDDRIVDLLAIRLSWECLLDDSERGTDSTWKRWQRAWVAAGAAHPDDSEAVFQRALELAYQLPLAAALSRPLLQRRTEPAFQAVFCIDVRSEVFRRALEQADPDAQTMGFAGFFGLPISYTPLGTRATRPQLPGLLAPALQVGDCCDHPHQEETLIRARQQRLQRKQSRLSFERLPGSAFTLVETLGLGYLGKLVQRSLPTKARASSPDHDGLGKERGQLRPRLLLNGDAIADKAALAARVLRAMNLTQGFAPLVLLCGHGSASANNPHAAGLDCGACCGQTGEVNSRALAALLNEAAVRAQLAVDGIEIPDRTWFLAGLHNTTTDMVELFDTDLVPADHAGHLIRLKESLEKAGRTARAERAPSLGLADLRERPEALLRAVQARAGDWAQTRPEWGLASNAAFIVAPRSRSAGIDLDGRAFLHDYDWRNDPDNSILELIMTAPMVVTHWINMQYYASTVDNLRYGSGNKVLHNVVGGRIGVFEGNGGDLRIGLPLQSLHDGERWQHTPLRLSVFIEAPRAAIEAVIAKHELVRQLVEHGWLYLFRIDSETHAVEARSGAAWRAAGSANTRD